MRISSILIAALFCVSACVGQSAPHGTATGNEFGSNNSPYVAAAEDLFPPASLLDAQGLLLPNPGASQLAFQFNAINGRNFITLPASLSAALPRGFTAETYLFLPASASSYLPIISRFNPRLTVADTDDLDAWNDFTFGIDETNHLRFRMGGGEKVAFGFDFASGAAVPVGEWVHVAVSVVSSASRNPFSAILFINGAQVGTANWAAGANRVFQSTESIVLGKHRRGTDEFYLEGVLDEVRLWDAPRTAADVLATLTTRLDGDTASLLAYYRLDAPGAVVVDSAAAGSAFHGVATRPLYTLGGAGTLDWRAKGVQGFAVDITLAAIDLVPTPADEFQFTLTSLPEHGGLFVPESCTPEECGALSETDLGATIVPALLQYVCEAGYVGEDAFSFAARRRNGEWSESATVRTECVEAPANGCLTEIDECGVCGGNNECQTGGCDGNGGIIDNCGVCGGDGSTCSCTVYKGFSLSELEASLLEHTLNVTIGSIESTIETLMHSLVALGDGDACGADLFAQTSHLGKLLECAGSFDASVSDFGDYVDNLLQ